MPPWQLLAWIFPSCLPVHEGAQPTPREPLDHVRLRAFGQEQRPRLRPLRLLLESTATGSCGMQLAFETSRLEDIVDEGGGNLIAKFIGTLANLAVLRAQLTVGLLVGELLFETRNGVRFDKIQHRTNFHF